MSVLAAVALTLPAVAADDPQTPCDPQFMQSLQARAWLEAQREITQNQNLIVKPDSVLEYSCFNQFLNKAASNFTIGGLQRQFSETDEWDTDGFDDESTDRALEHLVASALKSYLNANFPHTFLGGRLTIPDDRPDFGDVDGEEDYNCDNMAQVWEQARCQNFNAVADQDGFRDFFWYADNDPRKMPDGPNFAACEPPTDQYNTNLAEAFNTKQDMFVIPAADDTDPDGTPYPVDSVRSYYDLIMPTQCAAGIPTGVTVARTGQADKVCPNPGCSFVGGTCQ